MFDTTETVIPCGQCGGKTSKSLAWLKSHDHFVCGCGTRIDVDARELIRDLKKIDRAFDDLKRAVQKFGR